MRRAMLRGVRSFARVIVLLISITVAFHGAVLAQAPSEGSPIAVAEWAKFRQAVPGHFQDWIIAGDGPHFTLVYSEPPPTFTEKQYRDLFAGVFRGLTAVSLQSRSLGLNGRVFDFVVELDYGFAGASAASAVDEGIRALSLAIYGTTSGARAIRLKDLIDHPPAAAAPKSITISALQLDSWLFGNNSTLEFISPESGARKTLSQLMSSEKSGRYISIDNSLVVLLTDLTRPLNASDITNARLLALDSDLILGGVVDSGKTVAIIARARQESWFDLPPLRVEDIINLMVTKNDALAQSYDRTFPGAGRVSGEKDDIADWAPNYLSADLINSEFGSLLNQADAILKSQSLSNTVSYEGYDVRPIENPPYTEGVFSRLQATSLIFNFNTVGTGHWFVRGDGRRIFAQNRTGSFSVTYLPGATGRSSTISGSDAVAQAERAYTAWFDAANSKVLSRSVQYMAVYQLFKSTRLQGIDAYTDRQKTFDSIGASLKQALATDFRTCVDELNAKDSKFLDTIAADYRSRALQSGLGMFGIRPPSSKEEWVTRASRAAVAMRYDANLAGGTTKLLGGQIKASRSQLQNLLRTNREDVRSYNSLFNEFTEYYRKYECELPSSPTPRGLKTCQSTHYVDRDKANDPGIRFYEVDNREVAKFNRDKARLKAFENKLSSEASAMRATEEEIDRLETKLVETISPRFGDMLTVEVIANQCGQQYPGFRRNILVEIESRAAQIALSSDVLFSLRTPTIVKSKNASEGFVGGHNVDRQQYVVEIDKSLPKGQFVSADGKLRISADDADRMSEIAASMARVADADVDTQAKAFAAAIGIPRPQIADRRTTLGIQPAGNLSSRIVEGTSVEVAALPSPVAQPPVDGRDAIGIGRPASGGHLYFEELTNSATQRITVYGAYGMPSIIEGRAEGKPSMTVLLDSSLSARDVDAIIANYKSAGPQAQAGGGGGWRIPPADHLATAPGADQPRGPAGPKGGTPTGGAGGKPRLVVFLDEGTGRKRTIVETENGRIELEVAKELSNDDIVKLMAQEIERGAAIRLDATKAYVNGRGAVLLVTGFSIEQAKAISGDLVAKTHRREAFDSGIIGRLRSAIVAAFSRTTGKTGDQPPRIIDYLIEVKAGVEHDAPDYELSGRLDMTQGGLRFVLQLDKLQPKEAL